MLPLYLFIIPSVVDKIDVKSSLRQLWLHNLITVLCKMVFVHFFCYRLTDIVTNCS